MDTDDVAEDVAESLSTNSVSIMVQSQSTSGLYASGAYNEQLINNAKALGKDLFSELDAVERRKRIDAEVCFYHFGVKEQHTQPYVLICLRAFRLEFSLLDFISLSHVRSVNLTSSKR